MEKIRSPNDAWNGYLKTWIGEIAKATRGITPCNLQGGLTGPHMNPQLRWQTR